MKRLLTILILLSIAIPCYPSQAPYRHIEPETAVYDANTSPSYSQWQANEYIKAIKYSSGVSFASVTANISNVTGYYFWSNPSVDLRFAKGFTARITDTGAKVKTVTVGTGGTGENLSATNILTGTDFTSGWGGSYTVIDADSYLTTGVGGPVKTTLLTVGALYGALINGDISASSFSLRDGNATITFVTAFGVSGRATATHTGVYFRNSGAATTNIILATSYLKQITTPSILGSYFTLGSEDSGWAQNSTTFTVALTRN